LGDEVLLVGTYVLGVLRRSENLLRAVQWCLESLQGRTGDPLGTSRVIEDAEDQEDRGCQQSMRDPVV
jgi:hypothetical protein